MQEVGRTAARRALARYAIGCLALVASIDATAQSIYRCGSTYSNRPCADAKVVDAPASAASASGGNAGDDMQDHVCVRDIKSALAWFDPDSVKVTAVTGPGWESVKIGNQSIAAKRYVLTVNAKNSYGGYTGGREFVCNVSPATGKILEFRQLTPN